MKYNFPDLASECTNFIREYKLPDITTKKMGKGLWKQIVKKKYQTTKWKWVKKRPKKFGKSEAIQWWNLKKKKLILQT